MKIRRAHFFLYIASIRFVLQTGGDKPAARSRAADLHMYIILVVFVYLIEFDNTLGQPRDERFAYSADNVNKASLFTLYFTKYFVFK